jgi:hypothetical protein
MGVGGLVSILLFVSVSGRTRLRLSAIDGRSVRPDSRRRTLAVPFLRGGTLLQLGVPVALALYFLFQRQAQGVAFCLFFFFEQFLPIATYMADARAQDLPLLTIGDGDYVIHDWNYLFGRLGLLQHDTQIAGTIRFIGWTGMLCVAGWLIWRGLNDAARSKQAIAR